MPLESALVDANVLVYSVDSRAPQHATALALLQSDSDAATTLCVTSQVLCEFYSIVTNPRRVANPLSSTDALQAMESFLKFLRILPSPARSVDILIDLILRHPVTGGNVFDLQIVAAMKANNVRTIYTFNEADFRPFSELQVIVP